LTQAYLTSRLVRLEKFWDKWLEESLQNCFTSILHGVLDVGGMKET
jgi:hypothetical protein